MLPLLVVAPVKVALGALTSAAVLGGLWFALGRPEGAKSALPERISRRLRPARGA